MKGRPNRECWEEPETKFIMQKLKYRRLRKKEGKIIPEFACFGFERMNKLSKRCMRIKIKRGDNIKNVFRRN